MDKGNILCPFNTCQVRYKFVILLLVFLIFFSSSSLKINLFHKLPRYNYNDDTLLFTTESALHYRYALLIAMGKGIPNPDWQVEYPEALNPHRQFTLLMEYVSGYLYRFFISVKILPFHVFLVYFIAFFSSFSIIAIFFLANEIWNSWVSGIISSIFYAFSLPSFSRTIGNFGREDFALPILLFSLFFFIKAVNKNKNNERYVIYALCSGFTFAISLMSWHLSTFIYFMLVLYVSLLFLVRSRHKNYTTEVFNYIILCCFLTAIVSPVLRERLTFISIPFLISYGLIFAQFFPKIRDKYRKLAFTLFTITSIVLVMMFFAKHFQEYSHVFKLIFYKILFLGNKPDNPLLLPYDASVIWLGNANKSPNLNQIIYQFSTNIILLLISLAILLKRFVTKENHEWEWLLIVSFLNFLFLYLLLARMAIFFIVIITLLYGVMFITKDHIGKIVFILIVGLFLSFELHKNIDSGNVTVLRSTINKFIPLPKPSIEFLSDKNDKYLLIKWIRKHTQRDDVILTWFGLGPNILTYSNRPINIHSKFESKRIRNKYKEFIYSLYQNEKAFYDYCVKNKSNFFVYDPNFLLNATKDSNRYLTNSLKLSKKSAAYLLHFSPENLRYFKLLYQNSLYRVFQVGSQDSEIEKEIYYQPIFDKALLNNLDINSKIFEQFELDNFLNKIKNLSFHIFNSLAHFRQKKIDLAKQDLNHALRIAPKYIIAHLFLARIYITEGKLQDALNELNTVIQIDPSNIIATQQLRWLKSRFK